MYRLKNFFGISILHLILLFILFVVLIVILNSSLSFNADFIKHWSTYFRDDIVFVYNSLLYNEGLDQHHLDHPSLFTFIIFPLFYKLFFFLGGLDFYNLSGFIESNNINLSLSKLFYISRFAIYIFSIGIIFLIYKIASEFFARSIDAFIISFLFIFSAGFTSASNRIESGLIALFFLLLAFYFLLKFFQTSKKNNLIYLIFVFLFIFSAMMQKKIIYFSMPFLFISSFMFLKKNELIYYKYEIFKNYSTYKILLFFLYLLVFLFITFKTITNNTFHLSRDLDFAFLIANYLGLNLLLFFYIKFYQNEFYQNLLTYNLLFGFVYFFYKYFLIFFFSAPEAIWSIAFTNFLGQLNMFVSSENVKGAFSFGSFGLYFLDLISNLKFVLKKYFFSFTFQSVLIWTNLILFFININKIEFKEKISIASLFFGFLFIQSIILFRYEQDTYYLNSEFLLLFSLSIILRYFQFNFKYLIIVFVVIGFSLTSEINHLKKIKNENLISFCHVFENEEKFKNADGFYDYWTNKIPLDTRKKFCIDYNL